MIPINVKMSVFLLISVTQIVANLGPLSVYEVDLSCGDTQHGQQD